MSRISILRSGVQIKLPLPPPHALRVSIYNKYLAISSSNDSFKHNNYVHAYQCYDHGLLPEVEKPGLL